MIKYRHGLSTVIGHGIYSSITNLTMDCEAGVSCKYVHPVAVPPTILRL